MLLTPLAFTAAISGLLKAADTVAGIVKPMITFSTQAACREAASLVSSETKSVWAILKSVQKLLAGLDDVPAKQRAMIEIRQLVCIIGEGVLVLSQLESILADLCPFPPPMRNSDLYELKDTGLSRDLRLPETVTRLQGFKNAIRLVWDILQG